MDAYSFNILEEPQGKGRPRFRRNGYAYTPEKTREYEKHVRLTYAGPKFDGPLTVRIKAYMKKPMRGAGAYPTKIPDADNIAKAILDALNGVAYADDKQVVNLCVSKMWADKRPQTVVQIEKVKE